MLRKWSAPNYYRITQTFTDVFRSLYRQQIDCATRLIVSMAPLAFQRVLVIAMDMLHISELCFVIYQQVTREKYILWEFIIRVKKLLTKIMSARYIALIVQRNNKKLFALSNNMFLSNCIILKRKKYAAFANYRLTLCLII